mmetsp:Transcript_25774/g.65581  ORF Transcript_25774/g.65581 Transcript_25774/m.65581 type:complete len:288 (+) Transcript_25774:1802-2665(+)
MARQAPVQHLVIGGRRRGHEGHATFFQAVIARIEIVTDQRDMLDAFAIVFAQEFLDLALAALAFLVQRDADLAVRRRQRLGGQAGIFALDVEIADFLEVEELLIEICPIFHPATINIVRQVIDQLEAGANRILVHTRQVFKVDVIDIEIVAIAVDQVDDGIADAADAWNVQLARAGIHVHRLGALSQKVLVGLAGIAHAKAHAAGGWAMLTGEIPCRGFGLVIGDEVDTALAPQLDILGPVAGNLCEADQLEHRFQMAFFRRGKFDELETVEAGGIFKKVCHGALQS